MIAKMPKDKYLYCKSEGEMMPDMMGIIETVPVDMNGQPFPVGMSAADKSRNMKRTKEGLADRFNCC